MFLIELRRVEYCLLCVLISTWMILAYTKFKMRVVPSVYLGGNIMQYVLRQIKYAYAKILQLF